MFHIAVVAIISSITVQCDIIIEPYGELGRKFEGIGAISGGGATSKLLSSYSQRRRQEILEYLFKPNYAASLTQLKVEIGGDSQSTEGTEASHMHSPNDLDCKRGYEWWMVKEAKKINPNIEIHGLAWTFPGWLGRNPYQFPDKTADYIQKWVHCMNESLGVRVNYLGIWNERPYNTTYIKILRRLLDYTGYNDVKIIASDDRWEITKDLKKDVELRNAVYAIGAHYPGTHSPDAAKFLNMPLWASEDYSTFNDDVGAGCWSRILNQNYVNGLMTSTIAWNLIAAYADQLPFPKCSLMTANEPWSGHYSVDGPVWITAHTTQFTEPGWYYLKHGTGVGHLPDGGSYITLVSPDRQEVTIVVETMSHNHSKCIRPPLPPYGIKPQNITFNLIGTSFTRLNVYRTKLNFGTKEKSKYFEFLQELSVEHGKISLNLEVDELYTISTRKAARNSYPKPPPSKPFPLPHSQDFQRKNGEPIREPDYLVPQAGYFELVKDPQQTNGATVLQQMALVKPIEWCDVGENPIAVMGYEKDWQDMIVKAKVMMPLKDATHSIFIAARVQQGGCNVAFTEGIFAWLDFAKGRYRLTRDLIDSSWLASGPMDLKYDQWYELELIVQGSNATITLDNKVIASAEGIRMKNAGFVALGCGGFGHARYAKFYFNRLTNIH